MKDWKECPDCWGTGLIGGFMRPCETAPEYEFQKGGKVSRG